jgi:hypothetical protein
MTRTSSFYIRPLVLWHARSCHILFILPVLCVFCESVIMVQLSAVLGLLATASLVACAPAAAPAPTAAPDLAKRLVPSTQSHFSV